MEVFEKFLDTLPDGLSRWDILKELSELRADFAIHHALRGFNIDYEEALKIVRENTGSLSEDDEAKRVVIVAAIDNLVDFALAEEYQMSDQLFDLDEEGLDEDGEEIDLPDEEIYYTVFSKYNDTYSKVENKDIEYAMIVASRIYAIKNTTVLMYMTQGDERVRPWHLQYEGFTAPKSSFPAWLIPPIEHGCRCWVEAVEDIASQITDVYAKGKKLKMPKNFDRTFKESVALGGRIFSDEHPYFQIKPQHLDKMSELAKQIKGRYFNE